MRNPLAVFWLALAAAVVVLDLWTKQLAMTNLVMYQPVEVTPFLNWRLAHMETKFGVRKVATNSAQHF